MKTRGVEYRHDERRSLHKAIQKPLGSVRHSVSVRCGEFEESYARSEASADHAIDAVLSHIRFMAKHGWCPAGEYLFAIAGTKHRRRARITGPGRRSAPRTRTNGHG